MPEERLHLSRIMLSICMPRHIAWPMVSRLLICIEAHPQHMITSQDLNRVALPIEPRIL